MVTIEQAELDHKAAGGFSAMVADLIDLSKTVGDYDPADLTDHGEDEPTIDCRVQYHDHEWRLRSGDSSYDQDHRGHWGSSCVGPDLTHDGAMEIAREMVEQVLESIAMAQA